MYDPGSGGYTLTRYRKGWKYNFQLITPDGKHHMYKRTNLHEGFTWASKVINYFKIKDKDDVVLRITKVRVIFSREEKLITLQK